MAGEIAIAIDIVGSERIISLRFFGLPLANL